MTLTYVFNVNKVESIPFGYIKHDNLAKVTGRANIIIVNTKEVAHWLSIGIFTTDLGLF